MQLLSPEEVKDKSALSESDRIIRIGKLNKEESDSVHRTNAAKAHETAEKERIGRELEEAERQAEERKTALLAEIVPLEARKEEAMKPVDALLRRAEAIAGENVTEKARLSALSTELIDRLEKVRDREDNVSDREQTAEERHTALDTREKKIEASEEATKTSAESLAQKWVVYHKTVHDTNADLEKREKRVQDGTKANEIIREAQEKRATEQDAFDRQLKDRSATLERAAQEILAKTTK